MRKVKRLNEPQSLVENADLWTQELLDEIKLEGAFKGEKSF